MQKRFLAIGSIVAACFYLIVMLTFGSSCQIASQSLAQEDTIINYVESQIGNQETPNCNISSIISLCKAPIKKHNDEIQLTARNENNIKPGEFAVLIHPVQNSEKLVFSSTDIIYPFNYFW